MSPMLDIVRLSAKGCRPRTAGGCRAKQKPEYEQFMDFFHEVLVEQASGSMSEEEIWWNYFGLLIPNVQNINDVSLKAQYYPCKFGCHYHESSVNSRALTNEVLLDCIHVDMPLMIPALSLSDVLFSDTFQLAPLSQSQDMSSYS
ncbi:hypothetical protein B0T18DRAFT_411705 [Schizothecium vesticola]|uniref:Uncharacterized protein n=1 Tax=Schizothecium vesticola TaxID=314040 RepID=A0AA40EW65_9PEZI|nr:hypothetical protein B0T18DRAFT_411705 [Schizothecium vesticola]